MCNMCIVLLPLSLGNVIKCDCIIIIMALPPRVAAFLHSCLLFCLPLHVAGECAMDQLIRPQTFRVVARHRHTLSVRGQQCRGGGECHVEWQPKFVVINHAIWQRAFGLMRSLSLSLSIIHSFRLFLSADASVNSNAAGPPPWGASDKQTGTGSRSESQSGRSRRKEKKK